jgi:hypothetical protein
MKLLYDTWVHVRKNACTDFGNALAYDKIMDKHIDSNIVNEIIAKLEDIVSNDVDQNVRRQAELAISSIKEPP